MSCGNATPIYATVDKTKKTKCKIPQNDDVERIDKENKRNFSEDKDPNSFGCNYANIDVIDPKDFPQLQIQESIITTNNDNLNYANLEFAQSLEHYENSKELLLKAGISAEEIEKLMNTENESSHTTDKNAIKFCSKCGHSCNRDLGMQRPSNKQDDYLMMEPTSKQNSSQDVSSKSTGGKQFPGYLPMHPVSNSSCLTKHDILKMRLQKEIGDKSSSTPSLNASLSEACKKRLESDIQRVPGSAMLGINHSVSAANSPYLRRKVMGCLNESRCCNNTLYNSLPRKRSNSADSTKYLDDRDSVGERSFLTEIQNTISSKNTSVETISSHSVKNNRVHDKFDETISVQNQSNNETKSGCFISTTNNPENKNNTNKIYPKLNKEDPTNESENSVNVRRSSSVPCKSGHNRDSSSSNDSGVSIGSLKHRGGDFAEFELPLTTSMSTRRHYHAVQKSSFSHYTDCYHSSLPRRSKSVDPLRELTFQFQHIDIPLKSSSAEAEIPICLVKRDSKGKWHL